MIYSFDFCLGKKYFPESQTFLIYFYFIYFSPRKNYSKSRRNLDFITLLLYYSFDKMLIYFLKYGSRNLSSHKRNKLFFQENKFVSLWAKKSIQAGHLAFESRNNNQLIIQETLYFCPCWLQR